MYSGVSASISSAIGFPLRTEAVKETRFPSFSLPAPEGKDLGEK